MNKVFDIVYHSLKWLSKTTGLTYEEINIIVWFIIIPGLFIFLIDRILKTKYLTIGFGTMVLLSLLLISDFEAFSKALFQKSVSFLNWFDFIGINYIQASVLICVVLPLSIIGILLLIPRKNITARISNKKENPYI